VLLALAVTAVAVAEDLEHQFRVGFSTSLFTDVNENDAKASIRVWAQTVARERKIEMDPTAHLYDHASAMVDAMQRGSVDAMSTTFAEYLVLSREVETDRWFVTLTAGEQYEEYIMVVHRDAGFSSLDDLRGQVVIFHQSARNSMATDHISAGPPDATRGQTHE
jgi:phosphonate transport system substrate-binding protein